MKKLISNIKIGMVLIIIFIGIPYLSFLIGRDNPRQEKVEWGVMYLLDKLSVVANKKCNEEQGQSSERIFRKDDKKYTFPICNIPSQTISFVEERNRCEKSGGLLKYDSYPLVDKGVGRIYCEKKYSEGERKIVETTFEFFFMK
jgi:hypothetical protein